LRAVWDIDDSSSFTSITAVALLGLEARERPRLHRPVDVSASNNPSQQDQYSQEFRYNYTATRSTRWSGRSPSSSGIDTQGLEQQGPAASRWNLTNAGQISRNILNGLTANNTPVAQGDQRGAVRPGRMGGHARAEDPAGPAPQLRQEAGPLRARGDRRAGQSRAGDRRQRRPGRAARIYAPQLIEPTFEDWNFSYDLTVSYAAMDDVLLYGTYAKTFKTGGINQNGVPSDAAGNPILAAGSILPESVQHFELGAKTQFWDRRITLNVALFHTTIDDYQANVSNGQYGVLRGYLANADRVRTKGVEVDFSVRPSQRFTAYVNGA
jgi:iron complex outermembrane receptor protein